MDFSNTKKEIHAGSKDEFEQVARKMATPMKREIAANKKCFTPRVEDVPIVVQVHDCEEVEDFSTTQRALFAEPEPIEEDKTEDVDIITVDDCDLKRQEFAEPSSSPSEKGQCSEGANMTLDPSTRVSTPKQSTPAATPKQSTPAATLKQSTPAVTPKQSIRFSSSKLQTPKTLKLATPIRKEIESKADGIASRYRIEI